ncbi:helix-turn-helix domain-containing protein [Xanthobacter autotrophicus]|uniref:helix-turn-helix domain-containing protein n=1 Tax=Xanthobacter autotrophicus TaxID=280 RepID=UPI003728A3DE
MAGDKSILTYDLVGAAAIAKELGFTRGKIYTLVKDKQIPARRIGGVICARRSVLQAWTEEEEQKACAGTAP